MNEEALKLYSEEMGLNRTITLDGLISSHRFLRLASIERSKAEQETYQEALEKVQMDNKEAGLIRIADLKGMTIAEIGKLIE